MAMKAALAIGLFCFALCSAGMASANPGALDSSFGRAGKVVSDINATPTDLQIQPDGRIDIVGGPGVVRFLPGGALDSGFGRGGAAAVGFAAVAMATQG